MFLAIAALCVVAVLGMLRFHVGRLTIDRDLSRAATAITHRLSVSLGESVYEFDSQTIRDTLLGEFYDEDVAAVAVWSIQPGRKPGLLGGLQRVDDKIVGLRGEPNGEDVVSGRQIITRAPTGRAGQQTVVGEVAVFLDRTFAERRLVAELARELPEMLLIVGLLVLLLAVVANRYVVRPLDNIRRAMLAVEAAQDRGLGLREHAKTPVAPDAAAFDELRRMGMGFERMVQAIADRQAALTDRESKYRSLLENLPQRIFLKDSDGVYAACNEHYAHDLGIEPGEIVGKTDYDFYPRYLAEKYRTDDQRVMATGKTEDFEETYVQDGKERTVQTIKTPMLNEAGEMIGVQGIFWDITERKEAEEERHRLESQVQHAQKLESLGVLAGGIAHDFNNLLVSILGNADLALREMAIESPQRGVIQDICIAAKRASELTNQMLAYSGRGAFHIRTVDLNAIVREMGKLVGVSISKKTDVAYELADDLPAVDVDAAQIRQVVMNLVTNAAEAIGDESGTIRLATGVIDVDDIYLADNLTGEELLPGAYVFLDVSDTGSGMDEDARAKLFDPFFTTKTTGRGLGMAAVLGIVRGHHGMISVYSEPGTGSRFRVLLPVSTGLVEVARPPVRPEDESWRGGGTILVADDEDNVRRIAGKMLERLGFSVLTAADGASAVAVFEDHADDVALVLLDMTMPNMGGQETFARIQQARAGAKVILCSGYTEQDATSQFAGKGLAGFLQKPFTLQQLREKVRAAMGGE
jgi:PAS domain S-box-containing protein